MNINSTYKILDELGLKISDYKLFGEFVRNNTKKDGYTSYCKECHRKRCLKYYYNNKYRKLPKIPESL